MINSTEDKLKAYTDLAWVDMIVSSPKGIAAETELYSKTIKENAETETKTLLHLACGAGMNDYTFKKYFKITGVDISENMLSLAKKLSLLIQKKLLKKTILFTQVKKAISRS
ncbi:MAG: hypothetical protein P8Z50_08250 [candidate division WOR-3 bacterium]